MAVSLGELAGRFGLDLIGDPACEVRGVGTLANAGPDAVSFLANAAYKDQLTATRAAAVILRPEYGAECPVNALVAADPYLAYARIADFLYPAPRFEPGIEDGAVVAQTAVLGDGVHVAANAVVGSGCRIGARCYIGPGCVLGENVTVGSDARMLANCTLLGGVSIGDRSIVHPGAVLGSDGFGNAATPEGWVKVPQLGNLRIGSDVEIGANTTIDRGAIEDTVIGDGVRIDNLVQIAHNVRIGDHTAIASQSGISGSSTIGRRCMLAGQTGLVGHITVCDDVVIGGATMVTKDITEPGFYTASFPAEPDRVWKRRVARFRRLDDLAGRVSRLEKGTGKK